MGEYKDNIFANFEFPDQLSLGHLLFWVTTGAIQGDDGSGIFAVL